MIYLPQVHITKNSTMGWCRVSEYNLPITGTSHDKYGHCTSKITHNYSGWGGAWCRQPQCSKQQNNEQQTHASTHADSGPVVWVSGGNGLYILFVPNSRLLVVS